MPVIYFLLFTDLHSFFFQIARFSQNSFPSFRGDKGNQFFVFPKTFSSFFSLFYVPASLVLQRFQILSPAPFSSFKTSFSRVKNFAFCESGGKGRHLFFYSKFLKLFFQSFLSPGSTYRYSRSFQNLTDAPSPVLNLSFPQWTPRSLSGCKSKQGFRLSKLFNLKNHGFFLHKQPIFWTSER